MTTSVSDGFEILRVEELLSSNGLFCLHSHIAHASMRTFHNKNVAYYKVAYISLSCREPQFFGQYLRPYLLPGSTLLSGSTLFFGSTLLSVSNMVHAVNHVDVAWLEHVALIFRCSGLVRAHKPYLTGGILEPDWRQGAEG